jgi:hypothetical protein
MSQRAKRLPKRIHDERESNLEAVKHERKRQLKSMMKSAMKLPTGKTSTLFSIA